MCQDSTLEKVLYIVGDNGTYQKLLYWLFLVPINILIPWIALVPIFQASVPDHWCHVPGKLDNVSMEEWKNVTLPRDPESSDMFSKCTQYVSDLGNSSEKKITACQNGWDFDHNWYDRTLPMDQNWVCNRSSYSASWLSVGIAGNVAGTLVFNSISDLWGRKITIILTTQVFALFATCRLFITSEWGISILMFLSSMPFPAILQVAYILVLEQVSPGSRSQITSLASVMWTIGMCSVPLIAWLTRDWVLLGIVTSLPFFLFVIIWWAFPESPRWLVSKGRIEDAMEAFKRIGKINQRECPSDLHLTLSSLADSKPVDTGMMSYLNVLDFFKQPVIRRRTFLLVTVYTCNYMTYYILIYNTSNISGNEFLNFFFFSITELPSNFLGWVCSEYFGRRHSGVVFFLLTTILAGTSAAVVSFAESWVMITLLVTCKALVTVCYFVIYIQLAEIYPTSHRGTGIGLASFVSLLFGISGPYVAYTSSYWPSMPYVILLFIGVVGTVGAFFIPETLNQNLPQNLSDSEKFLIDESLWSYKGRKPKCFGDSRQNHCETKM